MHLKTVELVFAEQSHACPRTVECCACRHVLVDMNTMHPMYGGKDCSPALYLEEVTNVPRMRIRSGIGIRQNCTVVVSIWTRHSCHMKRELLELES